MDIIWITDPHLNFLPYESSSTAFGKYVAYENKGDVVVISGDIAESQNVKSLLNAFATGIGKPVYFVLGNHDYYNGSIEKVQKDMETGLRDNLTWLDSVPMVPLTDDTCLIGCGGWYDGICGLPHDKKAVVVHDFSCIEEFKPFFNIGLWNSGFRHDLVRVLQKYSKQDAMKADLKLREACRAYSKIVFVTHYPPFPEACWHLKKQSDPYWLPWFTSFYMGQTLAKVAEEHPDTHITVLCGHTHSPGFYKHSENLEVHTGSSKYYSPNVSKILTV